MKLPTIVAGAGVLGAQQGDDLVDFTDMDGSKIYATIPLYFGHWQAVPDLKLDPAYRQYIDQIPLNNDRIAFHLATMQFVANAAPPIRLR